MPAAGQCEGKVAPDVCQSARLGETDDFRGCDEDGGEVGHWGRHPPGPARPAGEWGVRYDVWGTVGRGAVAHGNPSPGIKVSAVGEAGMFQLPATGESFRGIGSWADFAHASLAVQSPCDGERRRQPAQL